MRTNRAVGIGSMAALLCACGWLLFGCASTPKVDWNSRIGHFSYDQAVRELGPPDKTAELGDGSKMADWIERRSGGTGLSLGFGTGFYGGGGTSVGTGVGVGRTIGGGDSYLRLVFDQSGMLERWEKVR